MCSENKQSADVSKKAEETCYIIVYFRLENRCSKTFTASIMPFIDFEAFNTNIPTIKIAVFREMENKN